MENKELIDSLPVSYTVEEKDLILEINEQVMSVDGTAEGYGGYSYDPKDYLKTSIEIFELAKRFFKGS